VSIVRIGIGESQKFADNYDAIFGKKKKSKPKKKVASAKAKKPKKAKKAKKR
jgi:hypothetical protein